MSENRSNSGWVGLGVAAGIGAAFIGAAIHYFSEYDTPAAPNRNWQYPESGTGRNSSQSNITSEDRNEGASSNETLETIDRLIDGNLEGIRKAYELLRTHAETSGTANPRNYIKLAKVCHKLAEAQEFEGKTKMTKEFASEGVEFAEKCKTSESNLFEANKWYAMNLFVLWRTTRQQDNLEKIKDSANIALKSCPNDPALLNLLGKIYYEATDDFKNIRQAIIHLERAEHAATSPWKANKVLLIKCYCKRPNNNMDAVKKLLLDADQIPVKTEEDRHAQKEIDKLKNELVF